MTGLDLSSYVRRSRALCGASPPASVHETRTLLVDPLLEHLGWDVHARSTRADVAVDDCALEYVLSVDGVPALFVAVDHYGESLAEERGLALLEAMRWSDVDRAIYTNGRSFLFLAGTGDGDRFACRRSELPQLVEEVVRFSRSALTEHLADTHHSAVARALALEREELVASVVDQIAARVDGRVDETTFAGPSERFVDQLIVSFASDHPALGSAAGESSRDVAFEFVDASAAPGQERSRDLDDRSTGEDDSDDRPASSRWTTAGETETGPASRTDADSPTAAQPADSDPSDAPGEASDPDNRPDPDAEDASEGEERASDTIDPGPAAGDHGVADAPAGDGEYVVRFFNERGSIGAIGASSSAGSLVYAAEYLLGHGLSGVSVPWGPDEGPTALNEEPTRTDGTPMENPAALSNGWYLELGGDRDDHRARLEELTARAGLRAMLTGDWETENDASD